MVKQAFVKSVYSICRTCIDNGLLKMKNASVKRAQGVKIFIGTQV